MRPLRRSVLAWALWLATLVFLVGGMVTTLAWTRPLTGAVVAEAVQVLVSRELLIATIGLVLATRRPRNLIGWLFLGGALAWSPQALGVRWVRRLLDAGTPLGLPAQMTMVLVGYLFFALLTLTIVLPLLLLPDGRSLSRRWGLVARAAVAGLVLAIAGGLFAPDEAVFFPGLDNPLALTGPAGTVASGVGLAGIVLVFGSALLAPVSLVRRFRRSRGTERQQLRWVAAGAVAAVTGTAIEVLGVFEILPAAAPLDLLATLLIWCLPVSVAVAVLRYRLWDLDRLISRTVAYTLLTGVLALPYLVLVPLAATLAEGAGNLAVAAATLAAAALFAPLRRRVQAVVDRRFARRRYDAARSIDAFAARLRDHVDLDALTTELLAVTDATMQPAGVSLWLRGPPTAKGA